MAKLEDCAAVLLAAGLSRRFGGTDKLAADFRGRPLVQHAADTIAALPLWRRIAVCRADDGVLARRLEAVGFEVVRNPDPARGLGSSLAIGVQAIGNPEAVLVCLADMPLVDGGHLRTLVERLTPSGIAASVARPGAAPMPPAAFSRRYYAELLQVDGDRGARHLLQAADTVTAPEGTLADFDTREDFV